MIYAVPRLINGARNKIFDFAGPRCSAASNVVVPPTCRRRFSAMRWRLEAVTTNKPTLVDRTLLGKFWASPVAANPDNLIFLETFGGLIGNIPA